MEAVDAGDNKSSQPATQATLTVACAQCELYGFLLLLDKMTKVNSGLLECSLLREIPISKGEKLFDKDQPFHSIYAVKSGSFKSYVNPLGGSEQVLGFCLPGELIGLDALLSPGYSCTVQALESSRVCQLSLEIPKIPDKNFMEFQQLLIKMLTRQLIQERRQSLLAARLTADERLAAFLINLSERYFKRGFEETEFRVAMLRPDIGSYLGLAVETVSRTLGRFREQNLIEVKGKHVRLLNLPCMRSMAQHCSLAGGFALPHQGSALDPPGG